MAKAKEEDIATIVRQIDERLTVLEDLAAWMVRADQRFGVGQRVQFNAEGERQGLAKRAQGGKVVGLDGFMVSVLLDGYVRPHSFHHSFFDPARRRKAGR